jgi:hypothetical protein
MPSESWQKTITGGMLELLPASLLEELLSSETSLLLETAASKEELLNDELELGYKLGS